MAIIKIIQIPVQTIMIVETTIRLIILINMMTLKDCIELL